jgi:hypothetical protein
MGGNDPRFLTWVFLRAAPGLAWRIALHFWPATLAIGAAVVWLVL